MMMNDDMREIIRLIGIYTDLYTKFRLQQEAQDAAWNDHKNAMTCADCDENDDVVLVECRDGKTRCAHHANIAGWCWWCGDNTPVYNGDDGLDGTCHDCRSADVMYRRRVVAR